MIHLQIEITWDYEPKYTFGKHKSLRVATDSKWERDFFLKGKIF